LIKGEGPNSPVPPPSPTMADMPPTAIAHIALASQVGGHAGVETTEDGSLIIKPVLHRELEFYQSLQQNPALGVLLQFTPKFLGTLKLEGTVDPKKPDSTEGIIVEPVADSKDMLRLLSFFFFNSGQLMGFVISTEHGVGEPFVWVLEAEYP